MKLHLPKVLFAAVVAALTCVQQAAAAEHVIIKGTDSQFHNASFSPETTDFTGGNSWKTFSNADNNTNWKNHTLRITASSNTTASDITFNTNFGNFCLAGIVVDEGAKVAGIGGSNRTYEIGHTDNTNQVYTFNRDFAFTPGTKIQMAGEQVWTIAEDKTVKLTASTITNSGDITISSGAVSISSAITNTGTVATTGSGVIVIDDLYSFNGEKTQTYSVNGESSQNGYASGTVTVISGGNVGEDTTVKIDNTTYTTSDGTVAYDDKARFWVNTGSVTKGGDAETTGAATAEYFMLNGGTLNIAEETAASELLVSNGAESRISLTENGILTANTATDTALMAMVTGTGTLKVTAGDNWGVSAAGAADFEGTTYVTSGRFRYNQDGRSYGKTLKLGEGAHASVYNTKVNTGETTQTGYTTDPDATLAADQKIVLETGEHEVHVNSNVIMDIYGSVEGAGTFVMRGSGDLNLKSGAKLENLKNGMGNGRLNIESGASVENLTIAGEGGNNEMLNFGKSGEGNLSLSNVTYNSGNVTSNVETSISKLTVTTTKSMNVRGTGSLDVTTLELGAGAKLTAASGSITLGTLVLDLAAYSDSYATTHTLVSAGTLTVSGSLEAYQNVSVADGAYLASVEQVENSLVLTYSATELTTTVSGVEGLFDTDNNMLTLRIEGDITEACKNIVVTGFGENVLSTIMGLDGITADSVVGITLTDGEKTLVGDGTNISFQGADGYYKGEFVGEAFEGYKVAYIPEPATATLSLLALAGLAARRRRASH